MFLTIGLIAYLVGLVATIPASTVLDENDRFQVGGTVWNGEAVLASTIRIDWTFAPVASLANLGFTAQWHMAGGGTDLAGELTQRGDRMALDAVSGQIDGTLLSALAPNLPFDCSFVGDLRLDRVRLGGSGQEIAGRMATGPLKCAVAGATALPARFPALRGEFVPGKDRTTGALATANGNARVMELRLTRDGMLSIWPTAMAVQQAPFLSGKRYDTRIE